MRAFWTQQCQSAREIWWLSMLWAPTGAISSYLLSGLEANIQIVKEASIKELMINL